MGAVNNPQKSIYGDTDSVPVFFTFTLLSAFFAVAGILLLFKSLLFLAFPPLLVSLLLLASVLLLTSLLLLGYLRFLVVMLYLAFLMLLGGCC